MKSFEGDPSQSPYFVLECGIAMLQYMRQGLSIPLY